MSRNILICIGAIILAALVVWVGVSVNVQAAEKKEPIRIGVTVEQTGPLGVHGKPLIRGIEACVHKVNKEGGVLGRPVEAIILDDKSSPAEAIKNVRDLIYTRKVDFIVQGINSASSLGVSEVCRTAKIPVLCNGTTEAVTLEKGHRYVFRAIMSSTGQSYGAAWYIHKHWPDKKNFYIIAHDFEFGHRVSADFWRHMQKLNPSAVLVGESWVKLTEMDYSPHIAKLRGAKPEIALTVWAAASTFVKQAKPSGVYDEIQLVTSAWQLGELVSWPKADVPVGAILGGTPWYGINNPENTTFVNLMKELHNLAPTDCEYFSYISTMFGIEAVRKAGTTNKEKIVDALEGLTLNTPVGKVTIRPFDHQSTHAYYMGRVNWSDKYGYGIIENPERIPVEEVLPSKAQVEAARKATK